MGCVPRPAAREEITFVLFVYWENLKRQGMSHGRAYMRPRVGVGRSAASGRSGRFQLRSAAPVEVASVTGPFCGPTDFRHSHDLKSYLRTSSMEELKETG